MILPSPETNPGYKSPATLYLSDEKSLTDLRSRSPITPVSPPRYPRRPSSSITYSFTPLPSNCMQLAAPPNTPDSQRPYHITVSMNIFTPTSFITSIRKDSWDGDIVGDFEMGATKGGSPGTLCLRNNEHPIPDVLKTDFQVFRTTWQWQVMGPSTPRFLYIDDWAGGGILTVYSVKDREASSLLARFTPRTALRRQGQPAEPPNLLVCPAGHDYFDDILLAVLIIERIRTSPSN
ncbi:hypothetical protein MKEN_00830800 [Mycena kentingensis (nom. inval.)]|nr:hypothetical protein MKEN_00830800 [Mycena kentingensis (nom. inval.)]